MAKDQAKALVETVMDDRLWDKVGAAMFIANPEIMAAVKVQFPSKTFGEIAKMLSQAFYDAAAALVKAKMI